MIGRARLLAFVIGVAVVQGALMPELNIVGVQPDLLVLMGVVVGLLAGPVAGAQAGFAAGLFADMSRLTPFALSALAFCVAGWAVGTLYERVVYTTWWVLPLVAATGSAAGLLLFVGFGAVVGETRLISTELVRIVAIVTAVNAAISPAVVVAARTALGQKAPSNLFVRR